MKNIFLKLKFLKYKKGFSIVGVLVASSIGLVLIMGLNQMLANIAGSLKAVEDRSRRTLFNERLAGTICEKISADGFDASDDTKLTTKLLKAGQLDDSDADPVLKTHKIPLSDLDGFTSASLRAEHNIYGDSYIELSSESESCEGDTDCPQNWDMKLVTQGKTKGVYIYNKPLFYEFDMTWKSNTEFECGSLIIEGAEKLECLTLDSEDPHRALVGCGRTQNLGGKRTMALGYDIVGSVTDSATANVFVGNGSGGSRSGNYNYSLGHQAGYSSTVSNSYNYFLGYSAGKHSTLNGVDGPNTGRTHFIGSYAGYEATVNGAFNYAIGSGAGRSATINGNANHIFGREAGYGATLEADNYFIGREAGRGATVASANYFFGLYSGYDATVSNYGNYFIGRNSGYEATINGRDNYFFGTSAGESASIANTADGNTFIGYEAGRSATNITGDYNMFFGYKAGSSIEVSGSNNTFINASAGEDADISGDYNLFLGYKAGLEAEDISANYNLFLGSNAGKKVTIEANNNSNIFLGASSGEEATVKGSSNYFFMEGAGKKSVIKGEHNVFVGAFAGEEAEVDGDRNHFFGSHAGKNIEITVTAEDDRKGLRNNFFGDSAGVNAKVSGDRNSFFGSVAGSGATVTGGRNSFFGDSAGENTTLVSGNGNSLFGKIIGRNATISGDWNSFFGAFVADDAKVKGTGNTFIGYHAGSNMDSSVSYLTNIANRILIRNYPGMNSKPANALYNSLADDTTLILGKLELCDVGETDITDCSEVTASDLRNLDSMYALSSKTYKRDIKLFSKFEKALEDILATPLFHYNYKESHGDHPEKRRMGVIAEDLPENLQLKGDPVSPDWPSIYGTLWAGIKALHAYFVDLKEEISGFKTEFVARLDNLRKEFMQELASVREQNILHAKNMNEELRDVKLELSLSQKDLSETNARLERAERELAQIKKILNKP